MSDTPLKKPTRKLTNLELSAPARGALRRLQTLHGWTKTRTVEQCLLVCDASGINLQILNHTKP